jgi:AbrB family looped-hinge helix DNA binding protein
MNTVVEIDKAGRIVVPKKLRDAMHLTPGTRLSVEQSGDRLVLAPSVDRAQLVIEDGAPLVFPADRSDSPILTNEMVNALVAQGRLERAERLLGSDPDSAPGRDETSA